MHITDQQRVHNRKVVDAQEGLNDHLHQTSNNVNYETISDASVHPTVNLSFVNLEKSGFTQRSLIPGISLRMVWIHEVFRRILHSACMIENNVATNLESCNLRRLQLQLVGMPNSGCD